MFFKLHEVSGYKVGGAKEMLVNNTSKSFMSVSMSSWWIDMWAYKAWQEFIAPSLMHMTLYEGWEL